MNEHGFAKAKASGLRAISTTRKTVDALEEAIAAGRWYEAGTLYQLLGQQAHWGEKASRNMVKMQSNAN